MWITFNIISEFLSVSKIPSKSHHECKNIDYQLKFHMDYMGYQLSHIHIPLQIECLHHQWNISSKNQYYKEIVLHIWPRSDYNFFDHFSSLMIFPSLRCKLSDIFWKVLIDPKIIFPHPIFLTVDQKHHPLHSRYDLKIVIKFFVRMILFNSSWFNAGKCLKNILFLWCITTDSISFPRFVCSYITPGTLCCTNTKKLWCNSTCNKTKNLGASKYVFLKPQMTVTISNVFFFHINSSPPNEPFLLSKSVYSVQNMFWVTAISFWGKPWNDFIIALLTYYLLSLSEFFLHLCKCE